MIVLDANILIRAVLGRRVRELLETYRARRLRFCAPDIAYADALKYLPPLLKSKRKVIPDVPAALEYIRSLVEPIDYEFYVLFEEEARERLRGIDEEDWPILATALALTCPIWTEDRDFFGSGVAVWTSDRIEIFLQAEVKSLQAELD